MSLKFAKGQGATEYLVLLAVVLIVAMVAIALLGFFPGLSYDAKKSESDSYWQGARPFQVSEHSQTGTVLTLVIRNVEANQLKMVNISVAGGAFVSYVNGTGGINFTSATPSGPYIGSGESKVIQATDLSATNCSSGSIYEYMVNFTYDSGSITNKKQYGAKTIIGKCS
ncbi:Uncharacterised protein [uncultured archaeon]|nr:Uncharacterised protein [uncultured archaeon]